MAKVYRFDDIQVDLRNFRVLKGGKALPLEPKALNVLVFLIEQRGRLVEKRELIDAVWNDAFVSENVLSRAIAQLRKALGDDAKEARYIETVPTRGYRFVGEVAIDGNGQPAVGVGRPVELPASPPHAVAPTPTVKFSGKLRIVAVAGVIAASLVAAGLVLRSHSTPGNLQITSSTQITTSNGLSMYPTFSPDGMSMAYSTDRGKGFEIFERQVAPEGQEIQITIDGGQNSQPAWSPDGKLIAYHSMARGGIWLVPALGGTTRALTQFGSHPSWSLDGQWIAFQSSPLTDLGAESIGAFPPSTIWKIRPDGSAIQQVTRPGIPKGGHGVPSWAPDGKHIAFVSGGFNLTSSDVWSIAVDGSGLVRLTPQSLSYYDPVFSPGGGSVLYGAAAQGLWKVRVSPGTSAPLGPPMQISGSGGNRIKNLAFSADGKKLLYSAVGLTDALVSVRISRAGESVGDPVALTSDAGCRSSLPSFSPDGSRIAFNYCLGRAGVATQIWLINSNGSNQQQLTFGSGGSNANWFPDGRRILFGSGFGSDSAKLFAVDLATRQPQFLAHIPGDLGRMELSPNGNQLAIGITTDGVINTWLLDVGTYQMKQLTFDKEMIAFPTWSRDGKFIAAEQQRGRETEIVVFPSSGGPVTQLTFDHGTDWPDGWSADGDKVLFAKQQPDGIWNVWSVARSTKMEKQLTHYTKLNSYVRYPVMSPRGDQIVYEYSETIGNIWMLEFK